MIHNIKDWIYNDIVHTPQTVYYMAIALLLYLLLKDKNEKRV